MTKKPIQSSLFGDNEIDSLASKEPSGPVICLGMEFENDEARREYFRSELRKKLPELRNIEGFPIGEDDDIIALSDPPYFTACPNPWLNDFITQWEAEKKDLEAQGLRSDNFEVQKPYTADVSEGKNNPIYMAHPYHTKVPHPAIMRYILHYTQPGDIVFDGFCGTGMTGVAANMCADENAIAQLHLPKVSAGYRHSICSDLSPFASLIAYNYTTPIQLQNVIAEANRIFNETVSECENLFETVDNEGRPAKTNFVVWSEFYCCPNCSENLKFWNAALDKENKALKDNFVCPKCGSIVSKSGTRVFHTVFDKYLNTSKSIVRTEPAYIVGTTIGGKRFERDATSDDIRSILEKEEVDIKSPFPINELPEGDNTNQPILTQGIKHIHEFFTNRNLYALSIFFQKINSSPFAEKLRFMFTGLIGRATNRNRFSPRNFFYGGGGWNLTGMNGTLFVPALPIETSVLEIIKSRIASFSSIAPFLPKSNLCAQMVSSATKVNLNSNTIDYIFTDPPFGGNIMYSELNYIAEAWLRVRTNNKTEAIVNKSQQKTLFDYQALMNASLREFYRVLKPGKWLTMEFSNTAAAVWNSIQNALQGVGFIVASVAALDKKQGSFKAVTTPTAVKQDLIISCFKPSETLLQNFDALSQAFDEQNISVSVHTFVEELLNKLAPPTAKDNKMQNIDERTPKILFDKLIAFFVQRRLQIPMDASKFQRFLRENFVERDGMFFTAEQAILYDELRRENPGEIEYSLFVGSEAEGIQWLKRELLNNPQKYADLQPNWMQDLVKPKKGDTIPELLDILKENFLQDKEGRWYIPDAENEADLERVRQNRLLREFKGYADITAQSAKVKIKEARLEALRAGFKHCYQNNDFETIVRVSERIPEELLTEDEVLMQYYDIATSRI